MQQAVTDANVSDEERSVLEDTRVAAELLRVTVGKLEEPAEPAGILTAGFRAEAPGRVKVLVHQSDFDKAKALLDEYVHSRDEIDWDQVDVGEPE